MRLKVEYAEMNQRKIPILPDTLPLRSISQDSREKSWH